MKEVEISLQPKQPKNLAEEEACNPQWFYVAFTEVFGRFCRSKGVLTKGQAVETIKEVAQAMLDSGTFKDYEVKALVESDVQVRAECQDGSLINYRVNLSYWERPEPGPEPSPQKSKQLEKEEEEKEEQYRRSILESSNDDDLEFSP